MTIKNRFILFFAGFVFLLILIISAAVIYFLHSSFVVLFNAQNPQYIPIMARKMFLTALWGFGVFVLVITLVSLPVGMFLSHTISRPYFDILNSLSDIAHKRLKTDDTMPVNIGELGILKHYMTRLMHELQKLEDYEKAAAWKDGAKMLIHELKNPLTPLKLSTQNLSLQTSLPHESNQEVQRILRACDEIETILGLFKNLVNIEFAQKQEFDLFDEIENIIKDAKENGYDVDVHKSYIRQKCFILSEKMLLKLLFINLIKNGLEENPKGFFINITENSRTVVAEFITKDAHIENRAKMFKPGYSKKGAGRGFGLFLCRKISDYLDLGLAVENRENNVVFTAVFNKLQISTEEKVKS